MQLQQWEDSLCKEQVISLPASWSYLNTEYRSQSKMSGAVQNALILSSNLGSEDFTGIDRNVPASSNYTKAAVKGGTASMYVVYPQPDFNEIKPTKQAPTTQAPTCTPQPASKVVETTSPVQLGFVARSLHGFDKDGIIIFEHQNYCGNGKLYKQSNVDISSEFPIGDSRHCVWGAMESVHWSKLYWYMAL